MRAMVSQRGVDVRIQEGGILETPGTMSQSIALVRTAAASDSGICTLREICNYIHLFSRACILSPALAFLLANSSSTYRWQLRKYRSPGQRLESAAFGECHPLLWPWAEEHRITNGSNFSGSIYNRICKIPHQL